MKGLHLNSIDNVAKRGHSLGKRNKTSWHVPSWKKGLRGVIHSRQRLWLRNEKRAKKDKCRKGGWGLWEGSAKIFSTIQILSKVGNGISDGRGKRGTKRKEWEKSRIGDGGREKVQRWGLDHSNWGTRLDGEPKMYIRTM